MAPKIAIVYYSMYGHVKTLVSSSNGCNCYSIALTLQQKLVCTW